MITGHKDSTIANTFFKIVAFLAWQYNSRWNFVPDVSKKSDDEKTNLHNRPDLPLDFHRHRIMQTGR